MSKWISIKEQLPPDDITVLTLDKFGHVRDRKLMIDFLVFRPDGLKAGRDVTHWMPMPKKPEVHDAENA